MTPRERIERLRARGYSEAQIAEAVGRSRGFIANVRHGRTPGRSLEAPLAALERQRGRRLRPAVEPPRGRRHIPERERLARVANANRSAGVTRDFAREHGISYLDALRSQERKDISAALRTKDNAPDSAKARALVALGRREPGWVWKVGETPRVYGVVRSAA